MNSGLLGGMVLGVALFFLLPNFFIAFAVMLLCFAAEVATYLMLAKRRSG